MSISLRLQVLLCIFMTKVNILLNIDGVKRVIKRFGLSGQLFGLSFSFYWVIQQSCTASIFAATAVLANQ